MANASETSFAHGTGFARVAGMSGTIGLTGLIQALRAKAAQRRVYRTTLNELQSLSRRDLNDLGLNKYSLHRIAYDAAYNKA